MEKDIANGMINRYFTLNYYLDQAPIVAEVLTAYLNAHKVEKPDIWNARELTLTDKGSEVIIGIWDARCGYGYLQKQPFRQSCRKARQWKGR